MGFLTNLNENAFFSVVKELLNAHYNLKLKEYKGSAPLQPDLWDENSRTIVEFKRDINISDFDLFNSSFSISDTLVNEYNPQVIIIVLLKSLSQQDKESIVTHYKFSKPSSVYILDIYALEDLANRYPIVISKYEAEITQWHVAYREVAKLLERFFIIHGAKSSEMFYNLCASHPDFQRFNSRLSNFQKDFDLPGLDPIHIFASINESNLWDSKRTDRLNNFLEILGSNIQYNVIDYKGCPTPFTLKIMAARKSSSQYEIWLFFYEIMEKGQDGLNDKKFRSIKNWYGVEISSITIFLFWIDSSNFLPIDKNTNKSLIEKGIYKKRPHTYYDYKELLVEKDTELYRRTALYSYKQDREPINLSHYSDTFERYFRKKKKEKLKIEDRRKINFRLLGISTPENGSGHLKVLEPLTVYTFYQCYDLNNDNEIHYDESKDYNIFNITDYFKSPTSNIDVNISAIVGKNGTGKSTLTELLYMAINNLTFKILGAKSNLEKIPDLHLKIYFFTDVLYKIDFKGEEIQIISYDQIDKTKFVPNDRQIPLKKQFLEGFFYTIAINYSHFALNSEDSDMEWVNNVFQKNDGYQAPIVINPMRKKGVIDINLENSFVKQRLLSNILQPIDSFSIDKSLRSLTDNKRWAEEIKLSLNTKKVDYLYKNYDESEVKFPSNKEINEVLRQVYSYFKITQTTSGLANEIARKYIFKKLVTIAKNYPKYKDYFKTDTVDMGGLQNYLTALESDPSHVAYKFKQAINFLKFSHIKSLNQSQPISIEKLSKNIQGVISDNYSSTRPYKTIELIPPPFFTIDILLNDGSSFDKLSSGEKQRIHSINSLVYHLTNLDSVDDSESESGESEIKYPYVNIFFDEIEMYFHPDMQRSFIDFLRNYLKKVSFQYIDSLNICFITHSPFILSDIPAENVIFLKKPDHPEGSKSRQEISENNSIKTFGANVYEILVNGFFFENGFMGEFAKQKINSAVTYLNDLIERKQNEKNDPKEKEKNYRFPINNEDNWDKIKLGKFIKTIGEPLISTTIDELYKRAYLEESEIDAQIAFLTELKQKTKSE